MSALSALCEFVTVKIEHVQRVSRKQAAPAASGIGAESPPRAVILGVQAPAIRGSGPAIRPADQTA